MNGRAWLAGALLATLPGVVIAAKPVYELVPREVAPQVYAVVGDNADFSFANGGNILNTGFVVGEHGVTVINTGPSKLYGEQLRELIARLTDKPVVQVFVSKLHPDHFLGNQAFADVPIAALPGTIDGITRHADAFTDNMYRLVGNWMRGTEPLVPPREASPGVYEIGGRSLELIALHGHTDADLLVLDRASGVLFTGGAVFHDRAATTPHANLDAWLAELDQIEALDFQVLVPSHGPPARDRAPIAQTRDYVRWMRGFFESAAARGVDMAELLYPAFPPRFRVLAVLDAEFQRSVVHLYPGFESRALRVIGEQY